MWEEATKALFLEDIESIDSDHSKGQPWLVILEGLKQEAEEKKEQWTKKRWTINRTDKGALIPREKMDRILFWVDKFVQIGDCAVQYDPGHAALAWAAIRFVLKVETRQRSLNCNQPVLMDEQVAVIEQQTFDAILEGMERISNLISRYAIFEDLYLHPQLKSYTGLEAALTELYRRVLKYLSKAKRFYSKSTSGMPRLPSPNVIKLPCHRLRGPTKLV